MPTSTSFWDHPIEKLEEALNLRKQIAVLQEKLSSLFGADEETPSPSKITAGNRGGRKGRVVSAEARARMAAGQKARWAKKNEAPSPSSGDGASSHLKSAGKQKGGITAEGRAKLAAAMKARWAARKNGGAAPNAKAAASSRPSTSSAPAKSGKRTMSPEARVKISEAAKRRWAKQKKGE